MGGQSKGHNWVLKLTMRFDNSHMMYKALTKEALSRSSRDGKPECVAFLAHYLMQKGKPMRLQADEHPKFSHDFLSSTMGPDVKYKKISKVRLPNNVEEVQWKWKLQNRDIASWQTRRRNQNRDTINQWHHPKEDGVHFQAALDSRLALQIKRRASRHQCDVRSAAQNRVKTSSSAMIQRVESPSRSIPQEIPWQEIHRQLVWYAILLHGHKFSIAIFDSNIATIVIYQIVLLNEQQQRFMTSLETGLMVLSVNRFNWCFDGFISWFLWTIVLIPTQDTSRTRIHLVYIRI